MRRITEQDPRRRRPRGAGAPNGRAPLPDTNPTGQTTVRGATNRSLVDGVQSVVAPYRAEQLPRPRELERPVDVGEVVEVFAAEIVSDDIRGIVDKHLRSPHIVDASYSTVPVLGAGRHRHRDFGEPGNTQRKFFVGGDAGFLLMGETDDHPPVALAEVGFFLDPITSNPDIVDADDRPYPRIVQMQGTTYEGDKKNRRKQAVTLLEPIRLGPVLTDLVSELAALHDYPAVGILPADANPNRGQRGFNQEAMQRRYDGTARDLGFTRAPGGLYVKNLKSYNIA